MWWFFAVFALCFELGNAQDPTYAEVVAEEVLSNSVQNTSTAMQSPYVVMVSIDGFRYDYAQKYGAKNILAMAVEGSSTQRLIPSFPSKTFPNHYTLATGLYPERHGIVANAFYDTATQKQYAISDRNAVEDGHWYGGIPLWNLAQFQGMCAASFYWVGSEADINGLHPKYYYHYKKSTPYGYRVKRVLEWLQLPEKERPHMITLYFSLVDTQGHHFGPNAPETKQAVLDVDAQIGALREGIERLGLPVYLIVTSDHGMDDVSKTIELHHMVNLDPKRFFGGPVAMYYTQSQKEKDSLYAILAPHGEFKTYTRENVPEYLHFKDNSRIGDLVLIADAPYSISYAPTMHKPMAPGGAHGYDPFLNTNMGGIFYIEGPHIKKGFQFPPFENIGVYPLVAHLLGLKIMAPIDGDLNATEGVLQEN